METKTSVMKELEGLAPTLAKLKKQHRPQQVPEGYFEQLPAAVLQRAEASGRPRLYVLKGRNRHRPAYRWAAAAVAVLLAAAFYLWQPQPAQASLATLSSEEAEAYIIEHIGDFELNLILESGWPDKPAGSEVDFMPELTPDDLEMYLEEVDWL